MTVQFWIPIIWTLHTDVIKYVAIRGYLSKPKEQTKKSLRNIPPSGLHIWR